MVSASQPAKAVSPTKKGDFAHFGVTHPDEQSGRFVVYTTQAVHLTHTYTNNPHHETLFRVRRFGGIEAVSGDADEMLLDLVYRLSYYTDVAYDRYIGIRISASDHPDYASKIVIYLKDDVTIEDVCNEIAEAIHGAVSAVSTVVVTREAPSLLERSDLEDYNWLEQSASA